DLKSIDLLSMAQSLGNQKEVFSDFTAKNRFFQTLRKLPLKVKGRDFFVFSVFKSPELFEAFAAPSMYLNYLVKDDGNILVRPIFWRQSQADQLIQNIAFFNPAFRTKSPQGVFEKKITDSKTLLIAYSQTKEPGIYSMSVVDRDLVVNASNRFLLKSLLVLLLSISLVILIGFFASHRLTLALRSLLAMTQKIAKGDFKVQSNIKSGDEIQELAENVEWMSSEVQNLMNNQVEKARMQSELGMVHLVQKNLFPPLSHKVGNFTIECRFASASEAGGDWFHYSIIDRYLFLWIGDATGHGAPAGMITAAAKSASSVIEMKARETKISTSEILEIMNRAVNATAKKSVMMTFFIAIIDTQTGQMEYANASHEFPLVIPAKEKLHKNDFTVLCDVNGKRLGEDSQSKYPHAHHKLHPGDTLFLYTDGITDLENDSGKCFGEGRLLRTLAKLCDDSSKVDSLANKIERVFDDFRGRTPLVDDLMYIVCRYDTSNDSFDQVA
ncbi:MAG: SpoIIE family protein phosphatase, partial [Pseudomonadota bacterium]